MLFAGVTRVTTDARRFNNLDVVPVQAGTPTPQRLGSIDWDRYSEQLLSGILGPRLRGDDDLCYRAD